MEPTLKGVALTAQQQEALLPLLARHMQRRLKRKKFEAQAVAMLKAAGCPLVEVKS